MKKNMLNTLFGLLIALSLSVAGCSGGSGGGNSGTAANASEVPNQVASAQIPVTEETTITVSDPNSPIVGTKVVIPKDAAIDPINVVIGYEDNLPAPLNANALSMGAVQVSKVIIPHVTGGGPSTFNHLVEITIPYDKTKAKGLPPVVVYWDETNKIYRPVAVVKIDRDKGLVTFKVPHFSRFMAIIVEILGTSMPNVDTGFRMGVDSILHINFGSYEYKGHCMAFASIASHYFSMKKSKKLYAFAQDGVLEKELDDELVRSALRYTYALLALKWKDVESQVLIPSKTDTGLLVLEAMIITGQPVHFGIGSSSKKGHSIVVYGYDSANARFRIYDSNFPYDEVTFNWNIITGFGSYSEAAHYDSSLFDNIGYFSDDTFGAPAQFEKIISDWESGALKDYFANLSVKDDKGVAQNLSFNSDVKIAIPSTNTVTLTGHFNSPTGNTNTTNYLRVMQNGKQLSVTGTAIPASGDFSFNVAGNISTDTEIVLMVSGHERDLFTGFAAYGKFTITPAPPTTTYSMNGTIHTTSNSGPVLSGAIVSIAGKTSTTSSTGAFSIIGIPAGTYALSVSKSGYDTYTNSAYYVGSDQSDLSFYLTQPVANLISIKQGIAPIINGVISPGEWDDANNIQINVELGWTVQVYYKRDESNIYVAFENLTHDTQVRYPEVLLDINNDKTISWKSDDLWFHVSYNICEGKGQYDVWASCTRTKSDWAANIFPLTYQPGTVEMKISYAKLGLDSIADKTIGIAFDVNSGLSSKYSLFPSTASIGSPSSWGTAVLAQ